MTSKKIAPLVLFLLTLASSAFATAQAPDVLLYNGEKKHLFSNPLEDFYESGKRERPKFMIEPMTISSGNWRGYIATWEIENGKLYLREIEAWLCAGQSEADCRKVTLESIFPGKVRDGRVSAEWFTGELRIPDGEQLRYVHSGYASIYERNIIFDVSKGSVGSPRTIDNTKAPTPSELELMKAELAKLKAKTEPEKKVATTPKAGTTPIVPGEGVFKFGIPRKQLEEAIGKGVAKSKYDDVYFVDYPDQGIQASFDNKTNKVHVIFLYNNANRYESFSTPTIRTSKGIDWKASEDDVIKSYGTPVKDYSDESRSWRRIEYPGMDFRFEGGRLVRIGILGPGGN